MKNETRHPLRIVVVADPEPDLSDAQALLIDRLNADPKIELCGRIAGTDQKPHRVLSHTVRAILACERYLVRGRILACNTEPARQVLSSLPEIGSEAAAGAFDLALALGRSRLAQGDLGIARFGEWTPSYGGSADPGWIGVAPDIREKPRVEVEILRRLADNPASVAIRRTSYNPKPGAVLTGAFVAEKSVLFLHHALDDLADRREDMTDGHTPQPLPRSPTFRDALSYARDFLKVSFRKLAERMRERRNRARQFWRISRGTGGVTEVDPKRVVDLPERAQVMADPFLFEHEGALWVFYEAMNAGGGNGWIEAARLIDQGAEPSVTALKRPYHLSFPFVIAAGDDVFMIPETQQSRRLEVWKATGFPTGWELHTTAFEGQHLAESSLFCDDDGQWWLLTNLSDHHAFQDHSSELYVFAIDGPDLKSITPHPKNPVVFGADTARNAGAIIRQEGRLFRPAQNNSYGVYGYGLNLMEITRLDASGYEERLFRQFTPEDKPGSIALHHLSAVRDQYVFDWCGE